MCARARWLPMVALALWAGSGLCQTLHYVEPGAATCPAVAATGTAAPKQVHRGAAVPGRIHVRCGFEQGSYTVTLDATDPGATFSPKTFVVNFGRIVGSGAFTVRFSTEGVHTVSASITANMGSPAVQGRFVSAANRFSVVPP
jgi:hypothetical protein